MSQISTIRSNAPNTQQNVPQTGGTDQPRGTTNIQSPPLRTPQQVLAESKQRFPQVDELVLKGERGISGLSVAQLDMLEQVHRNPVQGLAPVLIGRGDNLKVALMPTSGVPGNNPGLAIQHYVREGQALYERIMSGEMQNVPHGKEEVAKLMWFLQALASSKASESSGQHPPAPALFKEGAFSIEDPDHRLEQFLFTANSYPRSSSHLKEFQGQPGCHPRGTDVRGTPMPNGRKTVMFARMPGSTEVAHSRDPSMGQKGMLFLKMEPHGCRGLSTEGTGRTGDGPVSVRKQVSRFFANLKDTIGHAFGFFQSVGQRGGALAIRGQNNRERIPGDVKELYSDITNHAKALKHLNLSPQERKVIDEFETTLGQNKPLSSTGGIRVMIRNLEAMQKQLGAVLQARQNLPQALTAFAQNLNDALTRLKNHGDYPDMRIGNEIILMRDDAKIGDAVAAQPPRQNTAQNGVINKEDQGVLLAGYSYMLANIDTKDNVRGFELDMHRNLVKIGQQGRERSINHDHEAAKDAVLALADNDQRIAKALMTVANQSLGHSLCAAMSATGYKSLNAAIQPGNSGDYHISRLPDAPGGAKVFRVGWTVADRMGKSNNGELFTLGGESLWGLPTAGSKARYGWI